MRKFNYKYTLSFKPGEKFSINSIINACKTYPNDDFLVEIPNTIGISQDDIRKLPSNVSCVRIAGAHDDERMNAYKTTGLYKGYFDSVIYTKIETIKIIKEIEKIEKGINPNWSDLQKVIYIYDTLKRTITYDPKYKSKDSDDIRSFRGLISKKTVCAGYAIIFKELMDRQGINCRYIRGYALNLKNEKYDEAHAWNVVELDGKVYGVDLTWDNTQLRNGYIHSHYFLGMNPKTFTKLHKPDYRYEPDYSYESKLSTINPNLIQYLSQQITRKNDYEMTTFPGVRKDGSKFVIAQIGHGNANGKTIYSYYYCDILPNGKRGEPLVLYSDDNIAKLINDINFADDQKIVLEARKKLQLASNLLFSKQNIKDSLTRKTYYIGSLNKNPNSNRTELIERLLDIKKPKQMNEFFTHPTRRIRRSDGSIMLIQQMNEQPNIIEEKEVNSYNIMEVVLEDGKYILKKVNIFSDSDLFADTRRIIPDQFLSRERLDNIIEQTGGYVGRLNKHGAVEYDDLLVEHFDISKYVGVDGKKKKGTTPLPSFEELKQLLEKYHVTMDAAYLANPDGCLPKVCDRTTGDVVTDKNIINKVYLAEVWLAAAGVKHSSNDKISGFSYAFNDKAKEVYELICKGMMYTAKRDGVIDTVGMYKHIDERTSYKYSQEIVQKFFKTQKQVDLFNQMTYDALGMQKPKQKPIALDTINLSSTLVDSGKGAMSA